MKRILLIAIGMLTFAFYSTASQAAITSFDATSATLSKSTGAITLTGTIVCTAGDVFFVRTNILQVSGGKNGLTGGDTAPGTCSGGVDTWVAPQTLLFGSIKNGDAQVVIQAVDVNDATIVNQAFHQPVTPVP